MLFTGAFRNAIQANEHRSITRLITVDVPILGQQRWAMGPTVAYGGFTYEDRVMSMGTVRQAIQLRGASLGALETSFTLVEGSADRAVTKLVAGAYDIKRAQVRFYFYIDDGGGRNFVWFTGVISKWEQSGNQFTFACRTDDRALTGVAPRQPILKSDFPTADITKSNPFGLYMPLVYGIHNSVGANSAGFIPTINVASPSKSVAGINTYLVSQGWLSDVTALYFNGALQSAAYVGIAAAPVALPVNRWRARWATVNGKAVTLVDYSFSALATFPTANDIATVDCVGLEFLGTGLGSPILNPVAQIQHYLGNFVFDNWLTGSYVKTSGPRSSRPVNGVIQKVNPCNGPSFARTMLFSNAFKAEGARYIGGDAVPPTAQGVVEDWLSSHPMLRLSWGLDGQLYMRYIDHRSPLRPVAANVWPNRTWIATDIQSQPPLTSSEDAVVETGRISGAYCYDSAGGKFWQSFDAEDPASANPYAVTGQAYPWAASRLA